MNVTVKPALQGERLGLWSGEDFQLASCKVKERLLSPAVRWHVGDELVAVPHRPAGAGPFIWTAAPSILEHVMLAPDGTSVTDGQGISLRLALVPRLATNRSYYNDCTTRYFMGHRLRLRGTIEQPEGEPRFIARTIWREDSVIRPDRLPLRPLESERRLAQLIDAQQEAIDQVLPGRLLWVRATKDALRWTDQPILAFVLNGAQADDDESHGGHLSIATGRLGPRGEWADWIVNNVYPLDVVSEKGILPGMVPLENYLADLNSGQAYYRPSYMAVLLLRRDRAAVRFQAAIQEVFRRFYAEPGLYHHAAMNSTGMPIDTLRSIGWQIPHLGRTSRLLAWLAWLYLAVLHQDLNAAGSMFRYLMQEKTRVFPRAAFEAAVLDLLRLVEHRADSTRGLTEYECLLQEDAEAVFFVRIPQIPSSRAFGTAPVASFEQYRQRVPPDRSAWETITLEPRPFPEELREQNGRMAGPV